MSSALLLLAASSLAFDCVADPPRNVSVAADGVATSSVIGLPPEMSQWAFALELNDKKSSVDVKLNWPGDPIRAGKALAAFPVGPHDYSFVSLHPGPCLFTQGACLFMYTLSVQKDATAQILIQPSALGSDGEWSKPFQAYMTGRCTPKKAGG
jgi:hypothetical protein